GKESDGPRGAASIYPSRAGGRRKSTSTREKQCASQRRTGRCVDRTYKYIVNFFK
ncbi:unnamed protein product, partial [Amoebophrya sp. A25]